MARSYICGFELASSRESSASSQGEPQTSIVRTGTYALRSQSTNEGWGFESKVAGGTFRTIFRSVRFYIRIAALPSVTIDIGGLHDASTGTLKDRVQLNTNGTLTVVDSSGVNPVTSSSAFTAGDNLWHRVELDCGWSSGNGRRVNVDGVEWASSSVTSAPATNGGFVGPFQGSAGGFDLYFDDALFDDASFSSSGFPGAGQVILLKPISDNTIGTWTGGVGGTTNLWDAINNILPIGTAAETDLTQIENSTNTANQDGLFNCQSYTTGGVGASDTVNAVMALVNDGEDIGTGTKTGGVWINSNPTQTAGGQSFDYGDDLGALGTFPTNWRTHVGPVAASPSVTLGTSPVVGIRATSATTRVRSADFLGIYVDYTPAAAGFMPRVPIVGRQAVHRAASF